MQGHIHQKMGNYIANGGYAPTYAGRIESCRKLDCHRIRVLCWNNGEAILGEWTHIKDRFAIPDYDGLYL